MSESNLGHLRITEKITELVGNTPLLHLARFAPHPLAAIYAKLEYFNPGFSIKDRAALGMVLDAEERGFLRPGSTIIEPTAGNTGIGLALVGVARGYKVILCVPEGYSREKMKVMEALGGRIEYVSKEVGMQGAIKRAQELHRQIENSFLPQQFENPANPDFHERTTGREIIEQMEAQIDAVVIGAGTAGTFTGVSRAVKKVCQNVFCVLVQPEWSIFDGSPPSNRRTRIEGIGQSQFVPGNFDASCADRILTITECEAFAGTREIAATEGVLAGFSSGAAAAAARKIAEELGAGKRIVTIFPDSAERYMSQGIFETEPEIAPISEKSLQIKGQLTEA
ncbi:MAG: PLP-dependent cysteine synthase family protein [Pyrinomonadaceae bacterium]